MFLKIVLNKRRQILFYNFLISTFSLRFIILTTNSRNENLRRLESVAARNYLILR
ncbi:MAG: hypothetical protein ACR2HG_03480 [Pyrinomonadaceae bacterium]